MNLLQLHCRSALVIPVCYSVVYLTYFISVSACFLFIPTASHKLRRSVRLPDVTEGVVMIKTHLVVWLAVLLVAATSTSATSVPYNSIPNPALWTDFDTIWATSPSGPCPGGICQDSGECVCSRLSGNIFFVNNNKNNKTQPYVVFLKGTQTTRTRGFRCPCIPPAYTTKYPCIYIYIYPLHFLLCSVRQYSWRK